MKTIRNNENIADIIANPMLLYIKLKENGYRGEDLAYKMYQIQKENMENNINSTIFMTELAR